MWVKISGVLADVVFFPLQLFFNIPNWPFPILFFVMVSWSLSALVWKGSLGRKALDPQLKSGIYDVLCDSESGLQKVFLLLWVLLLTKVVLMRKLLFSCLPCLSSLCMWCLEMGDCLRFWLSEL